MDRLQRTFAERVQQSVRYGQGRAMTVGLERRTDPASYQWDGMRRGGSRREPFVLAQFTLEGHGEYADARGTVRQSAGGLFVAVIPSAHRYGLPANGVAGIGQSGADLLDSGGVAARGSSWSFFWVMTNHSYFVERVKAWQAQAGACLSPGLDSALFARGAELVEGVCAGRFEDEWAWERSLLGLMIELDRSARRAIYPPQPRDEWLGRIRRAVEHDPSRRVAVEDVARAAGLSRTAFAHRFREVTGLTPAAYATELRLDLVRRMLSSTDEPLKSIARATGFASANHLGKVFRRHHALTCGQYRRQFRYG